MIDRSLISQPLRSLSVQTERVSVFTAPRRLREAVWTTFLFVLLIQAHAHLWCLQSDLASGQSTGDPDQVQRFEGNQDKADIGRQVFGALRVHEVVRGVSAGVVLVAHSGGQIYPAGERGKEELQGIFSNHLWL